MKRISHILNQLVHSGLIKSSGVYTVASFINAAIPFLLLPLLTTRLSPADYGIITMFVTVQAFLFPILGVNLEGAVARKFYSKDTDLSVYIGNCLLIFSVTTACSLAFFFIFGYVIEQYTKIPRDWVILIPLFCAAQFICNLAAVLWQVREKPVKYAGFQISQSAVNALFTVLFIITLSYNWTGRILAIGLTAILFAVFALVLFWKRHEVRFEINITYIKHALRYGGGLVPHAIGGMMILMTNRLFLTKMIGIEESGIYGVANQVCSVITFLTISFNNAYVPWLFKKLTGNKEEDKLKIVKLTYAYFAVIVLIGMGYYLFQPVIFKYFVGAHFGPAFHYCFWITLGFVFQGMYFMVTNYINFAEKTHLQALVTICVGIFNIPLNYLCIRYFGAQGAAISFAAIFFMFFIFTWWLSAGVYQMPWLKSSKI
jgi:O-antigen/teichoic acid export membrane protein